MELLSDSDSSSTSTVWNINTVCEIASACFSIFSIYFEQYTALVIAWNQYFTKYKQLFPIEAFFYQ